MLTTLVVFTLAFANDGNLTGGPDILRRLGRRRRRQGCRIGAGGVEESRRAGEFRRVEAGATRSASAAAASGGSARAGKRRRSRAPVTYTSYGEGPNPLLLGLRPRSGPEDWVEVEDGLWATCQWSIAAASGWRISAAADGDTTRKPAARIALVEEDAEGGRIVKITCDGSGQASNHVQLWGPAVAVEEGTTLEMTFLARCTKLLHAPDCDPGRPFALDARVRRSGRIDRHGVANVPRFFASAAPRGRVACTSVSAASRRRARYLSCGRKACRRGDRQHC